MLALYLLAIALSLGLFAYLLYADLKSALLAAVIITSLSLGAFPWHLLPVTGIASAVQFLFVFATLLYFTRRKNYNINLKFIFNAYNIVLVIFACLLFIYVPISPAQDYGIQKSTLFFLKTVLPVLSLGLMAPLTQKDLRVLFFAILTGSLLTALNLMAFTVTGTERAGFENLYSVTAARMSSLGLTLGFIILLYYPMRRRFFLLNIFALGILLYGTSLTGSRGPLLAAALASLSTFIFLYSPFKTRFAALWRLFLITGLSFFAISLTGIDLGNTSSVSLNRIIDRFESFGNNRSDLGRLQRYSLAWQGILDSKSQGYGTGGFYELSKQKGITLNAFSDYPHNLILEVWLEQGWLGLMILIILMSLAFIRAFQISKKLRDNIYVKALLGLCFYSFFNSLISSDVAGNAHLWILLSLPGLIGLRQVAMSTQKQWGKDKVMRSGPQKLDSSERKAC